MFCPYFIVGVDLGVRAATIPRLARPVSGAAPAPFFLCEIIWVDLIYTFFRGGGQRSCVYYFTNYFRPSPRFLREIELQLNIRRSGTIASSIFI